jgi:hypothetical protein
MREGWRRRGLLRYEIKEGISLSSNIYFFAKLHDMGPFVEINSRKENSGENGARYLKYGWLDLHGVAVCKVG